MVKGQGRGVCCTYYLVIKEYDEFNGLCFRVTSGGTNFFSIERVTSNTSFESETGIRVRFPKDIA